MHRSRFAGFIIDCHTDDLDAAAQFWSAALGFPRTAERSEGPYVELRVPADQPYVEVQKVGHRSRVHIDIESDDLEAEATRLESLGARRVAAIKRWIVMEAPTGQRFCVVQPQRAAFEAEAHPWLD